METVDQCVCRECGRPFRTELGLRAHQWRQRCGRNTDLVPNPDEEQLHSPSVQPPSSQCTDVDTLHAHLTAHESEQFHSPISVADSVYSFYKRLPHDIIPVYPQLRKLKPSYTSLEAIARLAVDYCVDHDLSMQMSTNLYNLISKTEGLCSDNDQRFKTAFPTSKAFVLYITDARKWRRVNEGWVRCNIPMPITGQNKTGLFRPVLDVLKLCMDRSPNSDPLIPHNPYIRPDGLRGYLCCFDCSAMEQYEAELAHRGHVVLIDVHCDGLTLPQSGTQSVSPLRVRFPNVRGYSNKWIEVGMCPIWNPNRDVYNADMKRKERLELFHRFLFLVFESTFYASRFGFTYNGKDVYPRLHIICSDQKEERGFYCMKAAGSFRDCTICDMVSRKTKSRKSTKSMYEGTDEDSAVSSDEDDRSVTGSDITSYGLCTANEEHIFASKLDGDDGICLSDDDIRRRQLHQSPAPTRCLSIVLAQLALSSDVMNRRYKTNKFKTTDTTTLKQMDVYLQRQSASPFPPCLAAMYGLGTKPFRLYKCIAFDRLHVFDLGVLRVVADEAYKYFSNAFHSKMPMTTALTIANQRLLDIPRCAKLPRVKLFGTSSGQKSSGMTGKIRRDLCPFMWYSVLGLSKHQPDDDPLLQLYLLADSISSQLSAYNQNIHEKGMTEDNINSLQEQCFVFTKASCDLLEIPVNTKEHRLMHHVRDHLMDFGMIVFGSTSFNERMHKRYKQVYRNTNKHLHNLSSQLIANLREMQCAEHSNVDHLVSPGNVMKPCNRACICMQHDSCYTQQVDDAQTIVEQHCDISSRLNYLFTYKSKSLRRTWKELSRLTLDMKIDWMENGTEDEYVYDKRFTVHRRRVTNESVRNDAVVYEHDGVRRVGLVQSIIQNSTYTCRRNLIIRRLRQIKPDDGNRKLTDTFGHLRYMYHLTHEGNVMLDLVPSYDIRCPCVIVLDPIWHANIYGIRTRLTPSKEDDYESRKSKFFLVNGFVYASYSLIPTNANENDNLMSASI